MQTIFQFILIDDVHTAVMHIPNPFETKEPDYTIVLFFVKKLQDFPLIFHYDNQNHNNELFSVLSHEVRSRYMWNHDMQTNFNRRSGPRYMHIVDLNNLAEFQKYSTQNESVVPKDIIVFLVRQISVPQMLLNKLSRVTGVFVVTLKDSKLFFCSHSRKSGDNCILKETEIKETSSKLISGDLPIKGMSFRVGYLTNAPYVYQRANSNGIPKITGSEMKLLKMLSEHNHFRYRLVGVNHYNGSKYSTMLKKLERGSISWAIGGINQNIDRTRKYEFMRYIRLEGMTAMFYRVENTHPLLNLFKIQNFRYICLLVVLCMISLFLMEHVSNKWSGKTKNDKMVHILMIVAPLIEQFYPLGRIFRKKPVKFVFLIWWISCCIISVTFKTYLVTSFISSSQKSMTMLDLVRNGYRFESTEDDYWYIQQSCSNSSQCISVKKRYSFGNLCESSSTMKSEKLALIGEKHSLTFKVLRECNKLSTAEKFKVCFADDNVLGAEWQTWVMRKHSMMTLTFSKVVGHMDAAGILMKWFSDEIDPKYVNQEKGSRSTTQKTYSPLDLKMVSTPFILLFVGHLISYVVFFTELFIKN